MRLDSPVVAFPAWLGGALPVSRRQANTRTGVPVARDIVPGSIAQRRVALGLTQAEVAGRLGICRQTLQRLEKRPRHQRGARVEVVRLRGRVNDLYLSIERGRVKG